MRDDIQLQEHDQRLQFSVVNNLFDIHINEESKTPEAPSELAFMQSETVDNVDLQTLAKAQDANGNLIFDYLNADGARSAGDGVIDQGRELAFGQWGTAGMTDLQALAEARYVDVQYDYFASGVVREDTLCGLATNAFM